MRIDPSKQVVDYSENGKWEVGSKGSTLASMGEILEGSKTHDFGSLADGAQDETNITVTGAALGDYAKGTMDIDPQGLIIHAQVSAANTVRFSITNHTGGAINLASTTVRAKVEKRV